MVILTALGIAGITLVSIWLSRHHRDPLHELQIAFPATMSQAALQEFLAGDFAIVKHMTKLPAPIVQAYTEEGGTRLVMADPGQQFNPTDVIYDPSVPRERLIFAGVAQDRCFVHYEQGGIGHSYLIALFKRNAGTFQPMASFYCGPATSLDSLRAKAASGECQIRR